MAPLTELETYIQSELAKGVPPETIVMALTGAGWSTPDIEKAFSVISAPRNESISTRWNKPSTIHIGTSLSIMITGYFGVCFLAEFSGASEFAIIALYSPILVFGMLYALSGLIAAYKITPTRTREKFKRFTLISVALLIVGIHFYMLYLILLDFIEGKVW